MKNITVGKLAKYTGINLETVRYYEKIGLLPVPQRTESGYRVYDDNDVKRILFINRAKELGFTLKEIKELLNLKIESGKKCGDVKNIAVRKIKNVEKKIEDLIRIKSVLEKLVAQCNNESITTNECPILEAIELN